MSLNVSRGVNKSHGKRRHDRQYFRLVMWRQQKLSWCQQTWRDISFACFSICLQALIFCGTTCWNQSAIRRKRDCPGYSRKWSVLQKTRLTSSRMSIRDSSVRPGDRTKLYRDRIEKSGPRQFTKPSLAVHFGPISIFNGY